ncbi:hypothetical protein [Salinibacterium sp. NG253]|uniref:hypothetical protein n=1 Tax=Salinibacterium sp. NG253 TaxID=2792039 RepID=UPI0027DBBB0F|nr:hypothetical protein [Salinibacterium sp. NG253]
MITPLCGGSNNYDAFVADGEEAGGDEALVDGFESDFAESDFFESDDEFEVFDELELELESVELVVERESLR